MTDWTAITDPEIQPGQPAYASVAERLRDNLTALAEGDASVPEASKLTAGSFKNPTNATQAVILAKQGADVDVSSATLDIFFLAYIVVPGVYTITGDVATGGGSCVLYKNEVSVDSQSSTGTLNAEFTCAAGDEIKLMASRGVSTNLVNFQLKSEFIVPICQGQFFTP
jgi:hypothetical protein